MLIISTCPECRQQVTIPDSVDADAAVRCPICSAEYPLSEAMATVPPALIPIEAGPTEDLVAEAEAPLEAEDDLVLESDTVGAELEAEVGQPAGEEPGLDIWQKVSETPQIDTGLAEEAPVAVDAEAFAGFGEEDESEGEEQPVGARPTVPRRKKKKQKSVVKEILGALVGGFFGLVVGYYLLNYFGGPRFDFMEFYLPGVPHTYQYRAAADQGKAEEAEEPDAEPEKPTAVKLPQPEPVPEPQSDVSTDMPQLPAVGPTIEAPLDIPEPEPERKPLPADYVGPRNPPSFTPDELGKILKEANNLLAREDPTAETRPQTYSKLCEMGHVLVFVDRDVKGGQLADRELAVRDILQRMAEAPGRFDEMGQLAGKLLDGEHGTKGGILLAGTVGKVGVQEGLHGSMVQLASHPTKVSVMSNRPLSINAGDKALILGSIVSSPAENLIGYSGTKKLLIWVGMVVKVVE